MALARISVTVPGSLVAAADRRARDLDRSRSWVVAAATNEPGTVAEIEATDPQSLNAFVSEVRQLVWQSRGRCRPKTRHRPER